MTVGLYRKYRVGRVDGREDPDGTTYFVLKLGPTPDPCALVALSAYADACAPTNAELAADLRRIVAAAVAELVPTPATDAAETAQEDA